MLIFANYLLFLTLLRYLTEAKFVFELNDDFDLCSADVPMVAINFSLIEFIPIEGTSMRIAGKVGFIEDFAPPLQLNFRSMRLERGTWIPGEISRTETNLCLKLMSPMEPWFAVTRHFRQKRCPYKAGHFETLSSIQVGSFGIDLPSSFAGDWKFFIEIERKSKGNVQKQCTTLTASVVEV
ncbi:uncharacterized protein LOC134217036 [Armigeres subalbatus]|uniref:uncharacterized protein LOC134217036 n=1 Tax=Armigeres subalbatus TaxID=124917 RepID=UPI002ED3EEE9